MATNPTNPNDITDVRTDASGGTPSSPALSPMILPIRGEKRIIPSPVSPSDASFVFEDQWTESGLQPPNKRGYAPGTRTALVEQEDYYLKAAMRPFVDYVYIRLQHRGVGADKKYSKNTPAVYRFLINPQQVAVTRSTLDSQAMSRAGWQIGVWGEDAVEITLNGKTAGQYWSFGITDRYQQFTESYRNLLMLQQVFENNGYFFEGEEAGEGALAADFTRRRIKMHEDVELTVGNFVWHGMFDRLAITQNAEEPWLVSFNIKFVAWKERFRNGSPYGQGLIHNDIGRGQSYRAWEPAAQDTLDGVPSNARNQFKLLPPNAPVPILSDATPPVLVSESQSVQRSFVFDTQANDFSPPPTLAYFLRTPGMGKNG